MPGRLFSVNTVASRLVQGLFARNERLVLLFEGETGPFAVIFVGALNVGSMATVWHGDVTPRRPREVTELPLPPAADRAAACAAPRSAASTWAPPWSCCSAPQARRNWRRSPVARRCGWASIWVNCAAERRRLERARTGVPPPASRTLRQRAQLLDAARGFFRERGVLEVETPVASAATVTDVQIESLRLAGNAARWLQTSPEYPMKRLLAAGSGDIFQLCRVFRAGENSRLHNPEFTMIEWYRLGLDLPAIMAETAALAGVLLAAGGRAPVPVETISYAEAFQRELDCDPLRSTDNGWEHWRKRMASARSSIADATARSAARFPGCHAGRATLGRGRLTCLHHFPASQAALAQLDPADPRTALRFELYAEGMELANGYVELADPAEQLQRFTADLAERRRRGLAEPAVDTNLLAALTHGLPACAGVAMGFDRVAMLALGAASIAEVMAFPWERA